MIKVFKIMWEGSSLTTHSPTNVKYRGTPPFCSASCTAATQISEYLEWHENLKNEDKDYPEVFRTLTWAVDDANQQIKGHEPFDVNFLACLKEREGR